jgi:short-subunit dehydrogenase involved in D-alanine esterification of teichoic acids
MSVTFICTSPSANALNVRTKYFLPFLLKKKSSIMYTTSGLALVPIARCPNYNATKAALHQFIMSIRRQLQTSSVKVIELFPPAVQTELHDAKHQPTIENGGHIGITMDEFMETAWAGIVEGKEEIPVGFVITALEKIDGPRKAMMQHMPWDPSEFESK